MPDLRIIRPRTGVRLYLYPGEICEMVCDAQVLISFTNEELVKLTIAANNELNRRENANTQSD